MHGVEGKPSFSPENFERGLTAFRRLRSFRFLRPEALESFRYLFLCRTHQTFRSRSKEPDKARLKHWDVGLNSHQFSKHDATSGLSTSSRLSTSCLEAGYYLV